MGPITSAIGWASERYGATVASPWGIGPDQQTTIAIAGLPCSPGGTNGTGGMVSRFTTVLSSSGAPATSLWYSDRTVRASAAL